MPFGLPKREKKEANPPGDNRPIVRSPRRIIRGTGPKNRPPRLWPPEDKLPSNHLKTNAETAQPSDEGSSIPDPSAIAEESPEPPKNAAYLGWGTQSGPTTLKPKPPQTSRPQAKAIICVTCSGN